MIRCSYLNYEDLPVCFKGMANPWNPLYKGQWMLEQYDGKFRTFGNMKDIRDILISCFMVELNKPQEVRLYIDEFRTVFIWFSLFKIHVYVDLD